MFQQQTIAQITKTNSKNSRQLYVNSIRKQSRKSIIQNQRNISRMQTIPWKAIKSAQFYNRVQHCSNPYSLVLTMFQISQQINWRTKKSYIQAIIKKIHNLCQRNSQTFRCFKEIPKFQQKLSQLLYLGDQSLQEHLKLLLALMLSLNKKFGVLNEFALSMDILSMQKHVNVFWLLTQCQVSRESLSKICKSSIDPANLLPVITIIANFIQNCSYEDAELIIQSDQIQNLIQKGIFHECFQISRQSLFLINNLMAKNLKCFNFIMNNQNLINHIRTLNNQENQIFEEIIQIRFEEQTNS